MTQISRQQERARRKKYVSEMLDLQIQNVHKFPQSSFLSSQVHQLSFCGKQVICAFFLRSQFLDLICRIHTFFGSLSLADERVGLLWVITCFTDTYY